ncbi:MAG: FAD-dependent monooxygenase, partial [Betaproteobacteria bacterium]
RRCFMPAVDGRSEFAFHTQLKPHEAEERITEQGAAHMVRQAIGAPLRVDVLARAAWTAGHSLVADRFSSARMLIGGDAAHLFTPTGGLGCNTAVEDAVNLGWKLAAVLKGQASAALLDTYHAERQPLAVRNTGYAKRFADSLGTYQPVAEIEDHSAAGEDARRRAGAYFEAHGRAEFNIPGITFGGRYDGSRAIVSDGTAPPADEAQTYVPSAVPGGRPPHLWLGEGRSLFDEFGLDWTLLRLGNNPGEPLVADARNKGTGPADRRPAKHRGARPLRRGPAPHPARPGRGVARKRGAGRRFREAAIFVTCPSHSSCAGRRCRSTTLRITPARRTGA